MAFVLALQVGAAVDVAVVCALAAEAAPLANRLRGGRRIRAHGFVVDQGQIGPQQLAVVRAPTRAEPLARACEALLAAHRPAWLLCLGYAVGLDDRLGVGSLILASEVINEDGGTVRCQPVRVPAAEVKCVRLVSLRRWPRAAKQKQRLRGKFGAEAADLQSFTAARIAAEHGVRFAALRIVVEAADRDAPPESLTVYSPSASFRAGAAVAATLRGLSRAGTIWKLRSQAHGHANTVAGVLISMLPQLEA